VTDPLVVGADVYPQGWAAVALRRGRVERVVACATFREVLDTFPDAAAVGVDIPIGFALDEVRTCDLAARKLLGPLWSSVFLTPPRRVLDAPDYPEALERSRAQLGVGISRQAYGLRARILEVDAEVVAGDNVFEVHPEVCFRAMAGRPLTTRKATWAGMWIRLDLLHRAGIDLPPDVGVAGLIPPADVIDAAAAAWTAARIASHQAECVAAPQNDERGRPVTIWY